ncbi:MAG: serine/threonine-protein kinase [Tahibacter sp.]
MDAETWRRARALFDDLADLPPAQWAQRLDALNLDAALRAEVLALLEADRVEMLHTAVENQAPQMLADLADADRDAQHQGLAGQRVGAFRLLREIGRGGMGTVWLAERIEGGFVQNVAVKLIRPGWDAEEVLTRFRAERQILAGLTHPNIARLIDGGVTGDGRPWLALEYVDGVDLRQYCDRGHRDLVQRMSLFLTVCDAVSHAHARLVVHRDLKPSNLLVTDAGEVKLLDFGIAKLIDANAAPISATRVFTPEYAAPEQVRGETVTTAVDVYALGLLLYELLTGRRPYKVNNSTPAAYERAILDQEPTRPSLAVTRDGDAADAQAIAAQRDLTPQRLRRELRGDLDAIVLKALRKDPAQRYASVADLAADVINHLRQRPVSARRGNWRYHAGRFLRRHAVASAFALMAFAALAIGLVIALVQTNEARRQRDIAVAEVAKSDAALDFMGRLFQSADPEAARGADLSARDLLSQGVDRMRDALKDQPGARATLLSAIGQAHRGLGMYSESLPLLEEASRLAGDSGDLRTHERAELQRAEALHGLTRFRDELGLLDRLAEPADPGTAEARLRRASIEHRRGLALQALGDLVAAGIAYDRCLATRQALLGEDHRLTQEIALSEISLATLRDREADVLPLARATLAAVRRSTTERDPHRANTLGTLAMLLTNLNMLDEAETLRREEFALVQQVFGAEHPRSMVAENDLASVLYARHNYPEAARLFTHVLEQRRAKFGPDNTKVATVANNLAWCELLLGHPERARELAAESLRVRIAGLGPKHHTTAASLRILADSELALGDLSNAGTHLHDAVIAYDASLGPKSPTALGTLNDLVRWEVLAEKPAAGCATAQRAYALFGVKEADMSSEAHYQRALLAACQWSAGSDADAAARFHTAASAVRALIGDSDNRARNLDALGVALDSTALRKVHH